MFTRTQNKPRRARAALLSLALAFGASSCATFLTDPESLPGTFEEFSLQSAETDTNYHIYVYLPEGYTDDGAPYPVLYKLDGDYRNGSVPEAEFFLSQQASGTVPSALLVAVGYEDQDERQRDYADEPTGFAAFMEQELIPRIDADYNTEANRSGRALSGGSLGGLAVLHALFNQSHLYAQFISLSPSLLFGNSEYLFHEQTYAEANTDLDATLYCSVGREEGIGTNVNHQEFVDRLEAREYPSLSLRGEGFENLGHMAAIDGGFKKGVVYAFEN